ncbi:MAG: hypothetical protein N2663_05945 [Chlorobi bacterium]|nr:hypothetical protein [Chlorobiota bacterium]
MNTRWLSVRSLSWVVVWLVIIGTAILLLVFPTPTIPAIHTLDIFDTTYANGFRSILIAAETNTSDSVLLTRYATMLYHRMVPQSLDDTGAVQLELCAFDPAKRRSLMPEDVASIAWRNPGIIKHIGKIDAVDSGYVVVRKSSPWLLLGDDTLVFFRARIYIPMKGYRWSSLF